jgi:hypothetical protein
MNREAGSEEENAMKFLELPFIEALRRNHGLEHATMHVLSRRYPYLHLVGRSTTDSFLIYGDVSTEAVANAAVEALERLQAGERHLVIHPRCGTNLVVAGLLAGLSSFVVTSGKPRSFLDRLPRLILATTAAVMLAQPLGPIIQERVTTSTQLDNVRIREVMRQQMGKMIIHRVQVEEV